MENKQYCPICNIETKVISRYPNYICSSCSENPTDENGRPLVFSNIGMAGGFVAKYGDTGEIRDSHICFVKGSRCRADEARFGGIVIQPEDEELS